jgi:hypothetical protein
MAKDEGKSDICSYSHGGYRWGISKEEFRETCIVCESDGEKIMGVTGLSKRTLIYKYYTGGLRKELGPIKNMSTYIPPKK